MMADSNLDQIALRQLRHIEAVSCEVLSVNPVGKALWYIESHFANDVSLDEVAAVSKVSRYYMSRAFATVVGHSMQRYLRGRRLTEAARQLANGANDILSVALDHGYGSHEAFTRAFREQFGKTPEAVRAQGHVRDLPLVMPIRLENIMTPQLSSPRFEGHGAILIAGISERYSESTRAGIPGQWQRFVPHLGHVPGQVGNDAYGVCYNTDDEANMDYLCGVEVKDFSALPAEFARLRIGPQSYAVFHHRDHISSISETFKAIFTQWLPESEHEIVDAPLFERYTASFDGRTGMGGAEIWVPIKKK
jgi:AraC family transcriptional regulator